MCSTSCTIRVYYNLNHNVLYNLYHTCLVQFAPCVFSTTQIVPPNTLTRRNLRQKLWKSFRTGMNLRKNVPQLQFENSSKRGCKSSDFSFIRIRFRILNFSGSKSNFNTQIQSGSGFVKALKKKMTEDGSFKI